MIGATINGNTAFVMRAEKVGADTMLAHIVKMVQEAQMHKAPIQKLVDIVAGYFVWGVMSIAAITFLGWVVVGGGSIANALISVSVRPVLMAAHSAPPLVLLKTPTPPAHVPAYSVAVLTGSMTIV